MKFLCDALHSKVSTFTDSPFYCECVTEADFNANMVHGWANIMRRTEIFKRDNQFVYKAFKGLCKDSTQISKDIGVAYQDSSQVRNRAKSKYK